VISLPEEKREKGKRYVEKRKYPLCSLVSGPHPSENKNPFLFSSASNLPSYNPPPPPRYLSPLLASSLSTILPFALPRNSGTVPLECVEESHFRPRVRYQANPLGNLCLPRGTFSVLCLSGRTKPNGRVLFTAHLDRLNHFNPSTLLFNLASPLTHRLRNNTTTAPFYLAFHHSIPNLLTWLNSSALRSLEQPLR